MRAVEFLDPAHAPTSASMGESPRADADDVLTIDIDGWEGPLDVLLTLARSQKVDLRELSILDLTRQYLDFIENARMLKLELAADYLVMAAWLAYLKSALLLPKDTGVDPSPEELALRLQIRLQRLNAMREAGARLMARDRMARDVFMRGNPERLRVTANRRWECSYFDLVSAYGQVKLRATPAVHMVRRRAVMTLEEALARVSMMVDAAIEWTSLVQFLPVGAPPELSRSALASSFLAALELAKQGRVELAQDGAFAPVMLRVAR